VRENIFKPIIQEMLHEINNNGGWGWISELWMFSHSQKHLDFWWENSQPNWLSLNR
jgi:hypothetical protein